MKRHYTVPNVREVVNAKTVGPATDKSRVSPKPSQRELVAAFCPGAPRRPSGRRAEGPKPQATTLTTVKVWRAGHASSGSLTTIRERPNSRVAGAPEGVLQLRLRPADALTLWGLRGERGDAG